MSSYFCERCQTMIHRHIFPNGVVGYHLCITPEKLKELENMTAEEARKLSIESAERGDATSAWQKVVYEKIKQAAEKGSRLISFTFSGYRMLPPSTEQKKAIWRKLESEGYKLNHYSASDPRDVPYTTIEW